jgi:hypothetical protein
MAESQLTPRNERVHLEARQTDWSSLLARAIDDMTRIVHSELKLLSVGIKAALDEEIDRVLALAVTGMLIVGGVICGLAALILFLHEFAMLPWWQSFGITALVLFAIAIALRAFAKSRARTPALT